MQKGLLRHFFGGKQRNELRFEVHWAVDSLSTTSLLGEILMKPMENIMGIRADSNHTLLKPALQRETHPTSSEVALFSLGFLMW